MKIFEYIDSLNDADVYFLTSELNLDNVTGSYFSFEELGKDEKILMKKASYDYFHEKNIITSDFFGAVTVNKKYAEVLSYFSEADYCICTSTINYIDKCSSRRKLYVKNGKYIAAEYTDPIEFATGEAEDKEDADNFIFNAFNSMKAENEETVNIEGLSSFEKLSDIALESMFVTEFIKTDDGYKIEENIFAKLKNNSIVYLESDDSGKILFHSLDKPLELNTEGIIL